MSSRPVPSLRSYLLVWAGLVLLVLATVGSAYVPMGAFNTVANYAIATAKALLVMAFFMHLRRADALRRIFAAAGFFWLALLMGLMLTDLLAR